jgi:hypothetical protein
MTRLPRQWQGTCSTNKSSEPHFDVCIPDFHSEAFAWRATHISKRVASGTNDTLTSFSENVTGRSPLAVSCRARASTASGEERTRGWKKMAAMYPPYDDYQKRAGSRQIPVVVLEPIGPA